jgi:hypothetical protein
MLHAALIALVLGLVVWGLNWTGLAEMPTQVYWVFTVGGMLLMLIHVATRRPARVWSGDPSLCDSAMHAS